MRRFGEVIARLGLLLGVIAGLGLLVPLYANVMWWVVAIGLLKLTLGSSLTLIAGGAVLQRLGRQREERKALPHDTDCAL